MFLRIKGYKNKDGSSRQYLFLVATKRIRGHVRQITVANFGRLEEANELIPEIVEKLAEFSKKIRVINLAEVPIGHEVYPGNTNDINAFKEMIRLVKERYQIRRVIIVCDRGMVSKENLERLEIEGYEYIVGMRMRQLKEADSVKVLDISQMAAVTKELKAREMKFEGRRLIVCYNEEQEKIDKAKREEIIKRLVEKLKRQGLKSLLIHKEYSKYLKIEAEEPELDGEKVKKEAVYDGKFILETNTKLGWKEVVLGYKDLWEVEKAFRTLKDELAMGPIYHYTDRRIRAHIFICFLALVLRVTLQKALTRIDKALQLSKVMEDIKKIKAVKLDIQGSPYILRTELEGASHIAFRAVGLKIPPRIIEGAINKDETVVLRL